MKIKDIVRVASGKLLSGNAELDIAPSRISTDSRTIGKGDLFVALSGPNFDGNSFVDDAFNKGAIGAVVTQYASTHNTQYKRIIVRVNDTTKALGEIAAHHRSAFDIPVIAVTGSNGKTTTKDMIWTVLSSRYNVLRNDGTENNHIGVPQTLLRLGPDHEACVLEIGTNHKGEIAHLAGLAAPTIAVITNIGPSHLEFLKDLEGVYNAKSEILRSLSKRGVAIINGDDKYLARIKPAPYRVLRYGFKGSGDMCAKMHLSGKDRIDLVLEGGERFRLNVLGGHNAYNALAAITVGRLLGISYRKMRDALSAYRPDEKRLKLRRIKGITVIDDSYNSNPLSMAMALEAIKGYPARSRWVVSGDMAELGKDSKRFHADIGRLIAGSGVKGLLTMGKLSRSTFRKAGASGMKKEMLWHCSTHDEAAGLLKKLARPGDLILVKGSRAMKMERVLTALS